jgi:hypothetical protein
MRRLEHLAGVERMEVGEVVAHPERDLTEDGFDGRKVEVNLRDRSMIAEAGFQPCEASAEDGEQRRFQRIGNGRVRQEEAQRSRAARLTSGLLVTMPFAPFFQRASAERASSTVHTWTDAFRAWARRTKRFVAIGRP